MDTSTYRKGAMQTKTARKTHTTDQIKLILFFVNTFTISWVLWFLGAGKNPMLHVLGTFGPTITALGMVICYEGFSQLKPILSGVAKWRIGYRWYFFVFGIAILIPLFAMLIYICKGGTIIQTNDPHLWYLVIPAFFQILVLNVLGEEIGWRGFALPRLQKQFSSIFSSLILGVVWWLWHLPLFLITGNFHQQIPLSLFFLQSIALSILMTWLYNCTGASLLIVHLFHAASNTFLGVIPIMPENTLGDLTPLWIAVALLCLVTTLIVWFDRRIFFNEIMTTHTE
jgi:uncharacterized protein